MSGNMCQVFLPPWNAILSRNAGKSQQSQVIFVAR